MLRRGSPWTSLGGSPLDIHGREVARYISDKTSVSKDRGDFAGNGLDVAAAGTVLVDSHFSTGMK